MQEKNRLKKLAEKTCAFCFVLLRPFFERTSVKKCFKNVQKCKLAKSTKTASKKRGKKLNVFEINESFHFFIAFSAKKWENVRWIKRGVYSHGHHHLKLLNNILFVFCEEKGFAANCLIMDSFFSSTINPFQLRRRSCCMCFHGKYVFWTVLIKVLTQKRWWWWWVWHLTIGTVKKVPLDL